MLAAGINVGLGHDAAECNNSRDLFEVMKFASLIHRASRVDACLQQAPDVVRMATRNGAAALGHETGELEPGSKADVILVDLMSQMFTPLMPGNPSAPVLAPGLRRQRQLRGHHDHRRARSSIDDRAVHDDRRAEGAPRGQRRLPPRARPDGAFPPERSASLTQEGGIGMSRYLVIGDPVVTLGAGTLIPDGALIVEDDPRRARRAARGTGERRALRPACSARPATSSCRGSSTATTTRELAIGPGLYQFIFERANVSCRLGPGADRGAGPLQRRSCGGW